MSTLLHLYMPLDPTVYVDLRIFGQGPLTERHLETLIKYLRVLQESLTAPTPETP